MMTVSIFLVLLLASLALFSQGIDEEYTVEDLFIPSECERVAGNGDHLLLEYAVQFLNGTEGAYLRRPSQLFHVMLDSKDDFPLLNSLKGMCVHATRQITWATGDKINLLPLFVKDTTEEDAEEGIRIRITVDSITTSEEYEIFSSLRVGNITRALDLIDSHVGVNAVDEWGQTPLMIAVQMNRMEVVAALLNTRMPKVDVNAVKPSGYSALFYAVEKGSPSVLSGLLRRGADPNVQTLQPGSKGNTPLHFACLLEKTKHAELLLEYGALPNAVNEYGKSPLQLVPHDAVRSTKLFFKKMFEDAEKRIKNVEQADAKDNAIHSMINNGRNDL